MSDHTPRIVLTSGEPAGIGLDLCVLLAHQSIDAEIIFVADPTALAARANQLGLSIQTNLFDKSKTPELHTGNGNITLIPTRTADTVVAGQLNANNSAYVIKMLAIATDGCLSGEFDAMVTAPVHKSIINQAGMDFTGHTEFLAERSSTAQVVMMLVGGGMRVALATTHLPLTKVSTAITKETLCKTIRILHTDLMDKFGIPNPRIMVAGLNPHAGEGGYLGDEEIKVISPALDLLRNEGLNLIGPLPADTMFSQKNIAQTDAFLAMYHDQGLAVLKHASFGEGVNVTLGLPFIRTSVDHGTALDLAGSGDIEIGSLLAAIKLAIDLANTKNRPPILS